MRVSLIVPTLNEGPNVPRLLTAVGRALRDTSHEVLLVDDGSTDGTPEIALRESHRVGQLRVLRRSTAPGLSASVIDGMHQAEGTRLAVMDADLQHDPRQLPQLLRALDHHDLAIGSRYAPSGLTCGWSRLRETQSRCAAWWTRSVLGIDVQDPLSGFFALRREVFDAVKHTLQAEGWKVLLEILGQSGALRMAEVPITFGARRFGHTKMHARVVTDWLRQLARLRRTRVHPARRVAPAGASRAPLVVEVGAT